MKSKFNLFIGIVLLVFGFIQIFKGNFEMVVIDFFIGIGNLVVFYFYNKKE